MNLRNKVESFTDTVKHRWVFTFNSICVLSAVIASFYYIYIGIKVGKNFIELTSIAPCTTFSVLAIMKSFFHLINESEVHKLLQKMQDLETKENNRPKIVDKRKIIDEERSFLNTVLNMLYFLNCSMIVVFDMTPLMLIAIKYYKTGEFELMLPYLDIFSFIPYEITYWLLGYVHQVWSECIVLLDMGAADYLFFTCCTYIKIQFRLLQYDFERLISSADDSDGQNTNEEIRLKFVGLVQWHHDLIECSSILDVIYSKSTLFNFLSSSLVICLTGFNVTIVDDIEVVVTYVTFLAMSLMQVFFLCFFADMLMSASADVSNAVYNCRWYLTNHTVGKQILLVQTRAQKPCKLTAWGFADVNLNAFMRVLSTSWSYFALLQTIYGN